MENFADILRQLSDPKRVFVPLLYFPATVIHLISQVWQWEEDTGLPVFEDPNYRARRYIPPSFTSGIDEVGRRFVREIRGDNNSFHVDCVSDQKRKLVARILLCDLKKIQIQNHKGGVFVTKTFADLMPYDQTYPCPLLRTSKPGSLVKRTAEDLIDEINLNAVRGFTGPGTYPCRHSHCTVSGPRMTSSSVVTWGPGHDQTFSTYKKFTCKANNLTYLLHCDACIRENRWTTYIGESDTTNSVMNMNFHHRINHHTKMFSTQVLTQKYSNDLESVAAIAQGVVQFGDPDPDNILQDPCTHFNVVHAPSDCKYTILDANYETKGRRRVHEGILIHQFGDCIYDRLTMSGALNRDF